MSWRLLSLFAIAASCAAGCSSKQAATGDDAGDAASLADAGDASADAASDAGPALDDTAMPQSAGDELSARMRHLLEAIAQNNPDLAGDVLFPREGYLASRDSADPQKAWDKRVSGSFRRTVEKMHKQTKGIEHAKFVSFELGHSVAQLTPKKRDFKKPLWRVKRSKLTYTIDGKTKHIEIADMMAWRGAWYITKLR